MALVTRINLITRKCNVCRQLCWCVATNIRHASKARSSKFGKKMTREERYMKKLCEGLNPTKRRKEPYLKKLSFATDDDRGQFRITPGMIRRAEHLSAVVHENIFYCFCYDDVCQELLHYNFEISKVKLTPDLNNLNVYWNATGNKNTDDEIERLLKASRGKLRSALTKRRILNGVPPIQFIKDAKFAYAKHVDDLLEKADMGIDHSAGELTSKQLKSPQRVDLATLKSSPSTPGTDIKRVSDKFQSATYTFRDGPGARLVVTGGTDFGASSTNFSYNKGTPEELQSVGDVADEQNINVAESYSVQGEGLNLRLRNDIYDLDHNTLLMEVLQMKRRLKERGNLPETETSRRKELHHLKARHLDSGDMDSRKIHKLLKDSLRRSRHKVFQLDDVPLREDWQNEQLELKKDELANRDNRLEDDDSDGILEDYDYRRERGWTEK